MQKLIYFVLALSLVGCLNQGVTIEIPENDTGPEPLPPVTPFALGQPDFVTNAAPVSPSATNLGRYEYKIHSDGTRLIVGDYDNSRVLIWNTIPENFQQPPDVVLGQADFSTRVCNQGGISPAAICYPGGVHSDGTKLYVVDYGNNRVLIWNTIPTANNTPADVVLGQPDMLTRTANTGGLSPSSMNAPWHLWVSGGKLMVSDYSNHRILIWNSIPTVNQSPANTVVGQANMNSNVNGFTTPTAASLSLPYEVTSDGVKLIVADTNTNRVLIWNTIPTTNGVSADVVLGQADMSSKVLGTTSALTVTPSSVFMHNNKLYVLDGTGKRMLVWNSIPTVNSTAPDSVFGQPDFVTNTANTGGISQFTIADWPEGLYVDDRRIIVGDPGNYRILVMPNE